MPTPDSEDKVNGGQMMNYESDTFQDYESITIDELKEQTNNLPAPPRLRSWNILKLWMIWQTLI